MRVKKRNYLKKKKIKEIKNELKDYGKLLQNKKNVEILETTDNSFILVDGEPYIIIIDGKPFLSSEDDHAPAVEALAVVQGPRERHGHGLIEASGDTGEMLVSEPRRPAGHCKQSFSHSPKNRNRQTF